ncbi:uncharacterized protein ARB_07917 [Trichophyton benhamiae CBS 112371]|uniref:Uncharacterized protein n=1 Tax=Arthroderma benhamiae (strain ATCC MYA-4681 / CBS 112371) TaxID=663331 RepID=D4AUK0_ARTBC|nr:uncharacterized protein ARB_07917 [Trichophyton benhamiae CBS 112371]EFE33165.1 hypothetical protein ARB_07917 [Trichophyton benhamiae CBS 112371]
MLGPRRQVTSSSQPASQTLASVPQNEGLSETRRSKKEAKKKKVEKPAGQLSCSSSSRCFFFFGSSAFSSLVTAAPVRSTAAGAAALLYLYNCWFHGPARFSSMHPSSSRCMVAASTHACMPQQNPRKEQPGDGPQSSTSQKWELIIRQPPFPSPPLKPMSIGIICLVWPLKPQGSIRFLSTPPPQHITRCFDSLQRGASLTMGLPRFLFSAPRLEIIVIDSRSQEQSLPCQCRVLLQFESKQFPE